MYTITMASWMLDENRNYLDKDPMITKVNKPTLKEAMAEVRAMRDIHDMRFSTPYDIINVESSAE